MEKSDTGHTEALTDQDYWDSNYNEEVLQVVSENQDSDPIIQSLKKYLPFESGNTVCEVGCYPGRFLHVFGESGCELNGIDFTRYLPALVLFLKEKGYKVGHFEQGDFFKVDLEKRYDIVSSFGFIEHFRNYDEVIRRQASLVAENGYLVISVPNFSGLIQYILRYFWDSKNLEAHYLPSMNLSKWKRIVKKEGFKIVKAGPIGKFEFWQEKGSKPLPGKVARLISHLYKPKVARLLPKRLYSPYLLLVARRK